MDDLKKSVIWFLFLWIINIFIAYGIREMMYHNFDYCVVHTCEITHNFGLQDMLWIFSPFLYAIVPIYYFFAVLPDIRSL